MAGRDLPGPNSLDRKTKFQRNFNQLWWESEREREAKRRKARCGGGARRRGGGREVVLQTGCFEQHLGEEEPWEATVLWAGDNGGSASALPYGGHCLSAVVGDDADANEAALGLLHPAEPSWHRCCLPGWAEGVMRFVWTNPYHIHIIFGTSAESVYVMSKRLPKNSVDV